MSRGPSKTRTLNIRMGKDGERVTTTPLFTQGFITFCKRNGIPTINLTTKRRKRNA
jgi:hypothetical protein